jgi:hypothetical protein
MNEEQPQSKKIIWIAILVIVLLLLGALYFFMTSQSGGGGGSRTFFGNLFGFGQQDADTPRQGLEGTDTVSGGEESDGVGQLSPLFRQLANIQVAGGVALVREGKPWVRYVARETGHVFDVDPSDGTTIELTNTTIPRVYEAVWVAGGNSVVLRYLTQDPISLRDIVKTYLAHLDLPIASASSSAPGTLGNLKGEFLPDNISAVSVSPDGKLLFYLLPVSDGVSGTTVTLKTMAAKEVLRQSFNEWLPQLMNDGTIVLTTKPSANVPGFAYVYTPAKKTLTRLIREKNGLTTNSEAQGTRVLYGLNISGNSALGLYDKVGFGSEEGVVNHDANVPLATLPEKCAWSTEGMRIYCGAFAASPRAQIPDEWYQGTLSFDDTFWRVKSDTSEITFLADPVKQPETNGQSFDVFSPFIAHGEEYFYFTNKKDGTLWAMVIKQDTPIIEIPVTPPTPEEARDAAGSLNTKTNTNYLGK